MFAGRKNNRTDVATLASGGGAGAPGVIDHKRRRVVEELFQWRDRLRREIRFDECRLHQLDPAVAARPVDLERPVPHAQPRVPALLRVHVRPAEPLDEERAQPLFGPRQVVLGVHWRKDVVRRDTSIKCRDETMKTLVADEWVNLGVEQVHRAPPLYAPASLFWPLGAD